jgi:hypothetical protein
MGFTEGMEMKQPCEDRQPDAFEVISHRVQMQCDRLHVLSNALRDRADQIAGAVPDKARVEGNRDVSGYTGTRGQAESALDSIYDSIDELESQVHRLLSSLS